MSIKGGYFKKHLCVDLTAGIVERLDLSDGFIETYIGGRGFGAKLVWDNLKKYNFKIDPLGPENLLVVAPGPLTGVYLSFFLMVTLIPELNRGQHSNDLLLAHLGRASEGVMRSTVYPRGMDQVLTAQEQSGTLRSPNGFSSAVGDQISTSVEMKFRVQVLGCSVYKDRDSMRPRLTCYKFQTKRTRIVRTSQHIDHCCAWTERRLQLDLVIQGMMNQHPRFTPLSLLGIMTIRLI